MILLEDAVTFMAHESHINDIKFSPDGQTLFTAAMDNTIKLWSIPDWAHTGTLKWHEKSVSYLNLTSDGTRLITASSDNTIRLWKLKTGSESHQLDVKGNHARLSPDDSCLAVVNNPRLTIGKLDEIGSYERFKPFPKRFTSLAFSPKRHHLAIASDHRITLVDSQLMKIDQFVDLSPKGVCCLAFSPDGRWMACGAADKRVRVWALMP